MLLLTSVFSSLWHRFLALYVCFLKRQALCYLREPFFLESNLLGGQANKLGALAGALKPRNATAHCTLQYKPKKITSLWLNSIGL
jgi:hypothetical protein